MRAVSRFEANLLRTLYAVLQKAPVEPVLPLLFKPERRPKCLSRDAVELVQDALAKGCVHLLARRGWTRERFLRNGAVAEGRVWQRTPATELGLAFSPWSLEFLIQLTSGTLGTAVPTAQALTTGDRFLLYLALEAFRGNALYESIRQGWPFLGADGLCRLVFLETWAEPAERFRVDWLSCTTGQGGLLLEMLQNLLADRWSQLERKKEEISAGSRMRALGTNQVRIYSGYLDALASAQRWDLARCFLMTAQRLLRNQPPARKWIRNLEIRNERLADRQATYRAALAFVRQLDRLQEWQRQAVGVGYFDDGYAASQLWKADWEHYGGDALCERARAIVHELEPMK